MTVHSAAQTTAAIPKMAWFDVAKFALTFFKSFKFASKVHLKSTNLSRDDCDKFEFLAKFSPAELQI